MITENQARILAHALHEIRPAWGIDATLKVLERNADHPAPFADIMAAAVMAARDPETQTPGRIFQVQIHWPEEVKKRLPKPPECPDHIGQAAPTCCNCWADVKIGDRPESHIGRHWEQPPSMYDQLKQASEAVPTGAAFPLEKGTK